MKANNLSIILLAVAMAAGCSQNNSTMTSGIRPENLDTTVKPGDDFYQFADGGWVENNPLTAEYSRYGSFDKLAENTREQVKSIIEEVAAQNNKPGSVEQKIADLFNVAMDTTRRNNDGIAPLKPYLEKISAISSTDEIMPVAAELAMRGAGSYFWIGIDTDQMESKNYIVMLNQGGLSLREKEYYFDTDEATQKIRDAFKAHVARMFTLIGESEEDAQAKMESVMAIETRIAADSYNGVQRRNPIANYHKMSYEEFKNEYAGLDWDRLFSLLKLEGTTELSVNQPEPIKTVVKIINDTPLQDQKNYLEWHLLNSFASSLTTELEAANFDFYGRTMSGATEQQPLWKRAQSVVSGYLGEALGQIYVKKHFPAEAKARMEKLVANLRVALGQRIADQEWMSDETKEKALEKLDAFHVKIGYPDKWTDMSKLAIDKEKSLMENIVAANLYSYDDMIERRKDKPVDPDEWFMTPQTVNAYYNPTTNEICFPAGILQYPFFDMNADDAFNYGAIGVVIGHEMTHGFDDQGRLFDKDGNINEWWTAEDAEKFGERAKVLVDYFNKIEVLPGLHANGELTLGENIADHGGLMIAHQAFLNATAGAPLEEKDGFTAEQRFFLAYATVWANNIREERIRQNTRSDVHSLGRWRVNGALPHIDAWYEAFDVQEGDAMYIPAEQRAKIW